MSKVSRVKSAVNEEKRESPVKEMKKKMAANAEKEKHATEKAEKPTEKPAEKQTDKNAVKNVEKNDKTVKNVSEKNDKTVKNVSEKNDKPVTEKKNEKNADKNPEKSDKQDKNATEKKIEKTADKNEKKSEPQTEKGKEDSNKEDKSGKSEKSEQKKPDTKTKQNGREPSDHNGVADVTLNANGGADDAVNGTVSADSEDDDVVLVIDDQDQDEMFPELTYDDTSDVECFEPPTPEGAPSRSFTRRSQVKAARTPETPRPASGKQTEKEADDPKDSKVVKLKEDALATDRKLRSADSPKPEGKKAEPAKKHDKDQESPKKSEKETANDKEGDVVKVSEKSEEKDKKQEENKSPEENGEKSERVEVEVVVEVETGEGGESRKPDTNFSKSRVKVSPYRRSTRLADQTNSSLLANYTGNNTTMEMDITESSSFMSEEAGSLDDSGYLRGLRTIRGRNSYKPLKEISLRHVSANRSTRSANALNISESQQARPTGTVVGRKRKPDADEAPELPAARAGTGTGTGAGTGTGTEEAHAHGKRARLLERLAVPFRRVTHTRNADIVGINTDLPLTAPIASTDSFDPESLKSQLPTPPDAPIAVPLAPTHDERDNKRCVVM